MYFKLERLHLPKISVCCSSLDLGQTIPACLKDYPFQGLSSHTGLNLQPLPAELSADAMSFPVVWSKSQSRSDPFWAAGVCGTASHGRSKHCRTSSSNISPYLQNIISNSVTLVTKLQSEVRKFVNKAHFTA